MVFLGDGTLTCIYMPKRMITTCIDEDIKMEDQIPLLYYSQAVCVCTCFCSFSYTLAIDIRDSTGTVIYALNMSDLASKHDVTRDS